MWKCLKYLGEERVEYYDFIFVLNIYCILLNLRYCNFKIYIYFRSYWERKMLLINMVYFWLYDILILEIENMVKYVYF